MAEYIDNSALLPRYEADSPSSADAGGTPDWVSSLIIAEVNVESFGTFNDMIPLLSHCAETGINALWITPIADKGTNGNGYTNLGVNTVDPYLAGALTPDEEWRETDYSEGWEAFRRFVSQAHGSNIRIFLDIVSWGTLEESRLYKEHPDWYRGDSVWGGKAFDWSNTELQSWFVNTLAGIAALSGADGFRYDLEPDEAGYQVNARVKSRALELGRRLVCFSENPNERRRAYDFSQSDVIGRRYVSTQYFEGAFEDSDITDCVKSGSCIGSMKKQDGFESGNYKYYSHALSCHDSYEYGAAGDKIIMGYQAIFAPFIPIWMIGEEFNNGKDGSSVNILYKNSIKLWQLEDRKKRDFFESVKKMISIRRGYPELFEYFPDNHRNCNICRVDIEGQELSGYARYTGNYGALIIPNTGTDALKSVKLPFEGMGLCGYDSYTLTDLNTGARIASGSERQLCSLRIAVPAGDIGVFMLTACGAGGSEPAYKAKSRPAVKIYNAVDDTKLCRLLSDGDLVSPDGAECASVYRGGRLCGVKLSGGSAVFAERYNADGFALKVSELKASSLSVFFSKPEAEDVLEIIVTPDGALEYKCGSPSVRISSGNLPSPEAAAFRLSFGINAAGGLSCAAEGENGICVRGAVPADITRKCVGFNAASSIITVGVSGGFAELAGIEYDPYTLPDGFFLTHMNDCPGNSASVISKGGYPGGLASTFDGDNITGRRVTSSVYTVDGFTVRFRGLRKLEGHEDNFLRFCMGFCGTGDSLPRMRLVFDTGLGTLEYYSGAAPYGDFTEICKSDLLKYENLRGREFTVSFSLDGERNLSAEVSVGGNTVKGVIPSAFYLSYISGERANFFIAPANRNGFFSLIISGICSAAASETAYQSAFESARVPLGGYIRLPYISPLKNGAPLGRRDESDAFYETD